MSLMNLKQNNFIENDPVSGHRFVLTIGKDFVGAFTECTLPTLEFETEERKEGGMNEWAHTLIKGRKSGRMTLKRGILKNSFLLEWFNYVLIGDMKSARMDISVILFDSMSKVVGWWYFSNAVPIKWTGPQLKSDSTAVAIETLELAVHEYDLISS